MNILTPFKWIWRKAGRVGQVLGFWLPIFCALVMFALNVAGLAYEDQRAYLMELAPRSVYVLAIIGLAAGFMAVTGMDIANKHRRDLQGLLTDPDTETQVWAGALVILAGESLVWCYALYQIGVFVLRWQG